MMKENRGQALVEFILIIPILIFIILSIIDVANIFVSKYNLEDEMSNIANLYDQNKISEINNYATINHLVVSYNDDNNNYVTITISKNISMITPGLSNILGKNFKIETKRVIYHE